MINFAPIYVMSREKNHHHYPLFPDLYLIQNNYWSKLYTNILKANENYEWENKKEIIFWRGALTGREYNIKNWHTKPRLKLGFLSEFYPDKIDAKFSSMHAQYGKDNGGEELKNALEILLGNKINIKKEEEHLKYKYLISLDGHTAAWGRVPWIMLSNSVLFKTSGNFEEWFYPALKDKDNYIEVKEDLSDLLEKLEWAKSNDDKVKQISSNATEFVKNNLKEDDIEKQVLYILLLQHRLMDYKLEKPVLPLYERELSFLKWSWWIYKKKFLSFLGQ
jgi:hypothetical protein